MALGANRPGAGRTTWGRALALPGVLAAALAVRVAAYAATFSATFDTATVGLMALHILKGERPLFYYGQNYMGALEAYAAAALFAVFGVSEFVLSLSPILFSLGWVGATYLLFSELAGDRRVGLAAALCVAVPGWETLWQCIGSYGGYPAAFFLGTLGLWLGVRLALRELSPGAQWAHALGLGAAAALGVWTHYVSAAYFVTAALVLCGRLRRDRGLLPKLAGGAAVSLLGLLPAVVTWGEFGSGDQGPWWNFTLGSMRHAVSVLVRWDVPRLVLWPLDVPEGGWVDLALKGAVAGVLGVASLLYLGEWGRKERAGRRWPVGVPVLFAAVFLAFFLPHTLALQKAGRYVIPAASLLVCAVMAFPARSSSARVRGAGLALLAAWTCYNLAGAVATDVDRLDRTRGRRQEYARVVARAESAGLKSVFMAGGAIFGHQGQILSFYAKDRIRFVSSFDDRCQPAAQEAEAEPAVGYLCERALVSKVKRALGELGAEGEWARDPWADLLCHVRVVRGLGRSVPVEGAEITVDGAADGQGAFVADRVKETALTGPYEPASGFTVRLPREVRLGGFWLYAPDLLQAGLPDGYTVSVSSDGATFRPLPEVKDRTAVSYASGPQVFFKGYYGILESRFDAIPARAVRFEFRGGQGSSPRWTLSEVFLFEAPDEPPRPFDEDVRTCAAVLAQRSVDFTWCDRWLSARLTEALGAGHALPRFNPKYRSARGSRIVEPRRGAAVAVAAGLADECATLLTAAYGPESLAGRVPLGNYELLVLGDARGGRKGPGLEWNGHTLVRTTEGVRP